MWKIVAHNKLRGIITWIKFTIFFPQEQFGGYIQQTYSMIGSKVVLYMQPGAAG